MYPGETGSSCRIRSFFERRGHARPAPAWRFQAPAAPEFVVGQPVAVPCACVWVSELCSAGIEKSVLLEFVLRCNLRIKSGNPTPPRPPKTDQQPKHQNSDQNARRPTNPEHRDRPQHQQPPAQHPTAPAPPPTTARTHCPQSCGGRRAINETKAMNHAAPPRPGAGGRHGCSYRFGLLRLSARRLTQRGWGSRCVGG